MDDLSSTINRILNSEEGMAQLRSVAGALGLDPAALPTGGNPQQNGNQQNNQGNQNSWQGSSEFAQQMQPSGGEMDLSALLAQLQNAMNMPSSGISDGGFSSPQPAASPPQSSASAVNMLQNLIAGGNAPNMGSAGLPSLGGIDIATIMKLQRAYSTFTAKDKNTDLLLAVKPHLSEERQKKVGDAIKILGLLKMLPMLSESGLLDSLGGILGGDGT